MSPAPAACSTVRAPTRPPSSPSSEPRPRSNSSSIAWPAPGPPTSSPTRPESPPTANEHAPSDSSAPWQPGPIRGIARAGPGESQPESKRDLGRGNDHGQDARAGWQPAADDPSGDELTVLAMSRSVWRPVATTGPSA